MNIAPYISISARIRTNVSEIKHIDLYNAQYENPEKEDPFNTPAVFIEYTDGNWEDMTAEFQQQVAGFVIHVVVDNYGRTDNIDQKNATQQENDLKHLNIDSKVHKALKGFVPEGCASGMFRTYTDYDNSHDQLMIIKHTYLCVIKDETYHPQEVNVTDVAVSGKIVKEIDFSD